MISPAAGTIQEIYFRVGEMVMAGRPVLSLLPPDNTRVRFFVPQANLPEIHIGDRIVVSCDGCASGLAARVNFISAQAEFTPPVIYSQEERARQLLLFGYDVNTTPRHLPTAVLIHEENDLVRSVLAALRNTLYFLITRVARSEAEMDHWMRRRRAVRRRDPRRL
jgi:hypothetical protein